mmetsp:Transcript_90406/g.229869  ORF Transcript_90406/g.229869 Transcript_90406/m.229869 type:complete len:358 (+) Transcript_90406:920-1993(+)
MAEALLGARPGGRHELLGVELRLGERGRQRAAVRLQGHVELGKVLADDFQKRALRLGQEAEGLDVLGHTARNVDRRWSSNLDVIYAIPQVLHLHQALLALLDEALGQVLAAELHSGQNLAAVLHIQGLQGSLRLLNLLTQRILGHAHRLRHLLHETSDVPGAVHHGVVQGCDLGDRTIVHFQVRLYLFNPLFLVAATARQLQLQGEEGSLDGRHLSFLLLQLGTEARLVRDLLRLRGVQVAPHELNDLLILHSPPRCLGRSCGHGRAAESGLHPPLEATELLHLLTDGLVELAVLVVHGPLHVGHGLEAGPRLGFQLFLQALLEAHEAHAHLLRAALHDLLHNGGENVCPHVRREHA